MANENGEPGVNSHLTGASNSQPGNNSQPKIVRPAEVGLSRRPGEALAKTLLRYQRKYGLPGLFITNH